MNALLKTALLFFVLLLCGFAALITHHLRREMAAPEPRELYSVVQRQLADFRAENYASAYLHAASGVQQKFSRAQFEQMIRRQYSEMTHPARVEFGIVKTDGASALVQVFVANEGGSTRAFLYSLVAENGAWKINGVEPLPPPPATRSPSDLRI